MQINIYSIDRKQKIDIIEDIIKQSRKFANIKDVSLFDKKNNTPKRYSQLFEKYLINGYNIALSPEGRLVDSFEFANLLKDRASINFFIGGAYGLEDSFKQKCDIVISLTPLTLSHKIAKIVLFEQLFRGLAINNNHPYHK
jgi:23S rRNA (pseudouridine1915-N3)-methyltransferase